MPERKLYLKCFGCNEGFDVSGVLNWKKENNKLVVEQSSELVIFFFEHHRDHRIGSGHNEGELFINNGGQEVGVLQLGRNSDLMSRSLIWTNLVLSEFGSKLK
jgi:hypothetical protein